MTQASNQITKKDIFYNKEHYKKKQINKIINKAIKQSKAKSKQKRAIKKEAKKLFWCLGFDLQQIRNFIILELAKI